MKYVVTLSLVLLAAGGIIMANFYPAIHVKECVGNKCTKNLCEYISTVECCTPDQCYEISGIFL